VTTFDRPTQDWTRDQWGRPKITAPPGVTWKHPTNGRKQTHRGYTRVTTFAGALDDQSNLTRWKIRRAMLGLAARPDYVTAVAALTAEDRDRADLDAIAEKALEAAGPNRADLGTALHGFTERLDRGEDLGNVPEDYRADLEAYARVTRGVLTYEQIECRMVCDEHETAGTPDRLGWCSIPDPDGVADELRVIDLKTGRVDYPLKFATQLGEYAHSALYDPVTGERTAVPLNTRWGLIVELPVGTGECRLHWLDLTVGRQGIDLAGPVRAFRKLRADAVLHPLELDAPPAIVPVAEPEQNGNPAPATGMPEPEAAADAARDAGLIPAHPWQPSSASVSDLCAALVMRNGGGDQCGLPRRHAVHDDPREGQDFDWRQDEDAADTDGTDDPILVAVAQLQDGHQAATLYRQHAAEWGQVHTDAVTERLAELKRLEALETPQAALVAAIATAADTGAVTALWRQHHGTDTWTAEHDAAAAARVAELTA